MSFTHAGLSTISGSGIFQKSSHSSCYKRLTQLLSEEKGCSYEKSIDGRIKRSLDILRAESGLLPTELHLLHSVVSNSVHIILDSGERMDYNEFMENSKGLYAAHTTVIPNNDESLLRLSEYMGVIGLYSGYVKLVGKIVG